MIKILFPDGSEKEFEKGISIEEIAGSISSGLKKQSVAGYVNGELYDLNRPIEQDSEIRIVTKKDKEAYINSERTKYLSGVSRQLTSSINSYVENVGYLYGMHYNNEVEKKKKDRLDKINEIQTYPVLLN